MLRDNEQIQEVAEKIWRSFQCNRLPSPDCAASNPAWRTDRIDAIQEVVGRSRPRKQQLLKFLGATFGATKLDELSNAQIDVAWREVSTW